MVTHIFKKILSVKQDMRTRKGVTLFLTITLLSLTLSIAIGIFNLVYSEILISGEIRSSFFALYATDEIIERTTYLDKMMKVVCPTLGADCYTTAFAPALNGACSLVRVTKNFTTRKTEVTGIGQYPCDSASPLLTKRSFISTFAMHEFEKLSAWWPLNDSGQSLRDLTANANNGALGENTAIETADPAWDGTVFVSGGRTLRFASEDPANTDRATALNSASLNINWPISIEAWVCNKLPDETQETIVKKSGGVGVTSYWFYIRNRTELRFAFGSSVVLPGTTGANDSFRIGANVDQLTGAGRSNFSGLIDEVKIFNRTLQQNDITHNFSAYASKAGGGC